jgi:predicted kinase
MRDVGANGSESHVPITIIGGAPGAGKSSLARLLASSEPDGVHIESDAFFRFVPHRLDPSLPTARVQNEVIVRAYTRASVEYAESGYSVYLEGVIGPWLLPIIAAIATPFDYVLLDVSLEIALARVQSRGTQSSATPEVIRRMHPQFAAAIPASRRHVVDTNGRSLSEVATELRSARAAGALAIRPS